MLSTHWAVSHKYNRSSDDSIFMASSYLIGSKCKHYFLWSILHRTISSQCLDIKSCWEDDGKVFAPVYHPLLMLLSSVRGEKSRGGTRIHCVHSINWWGWWAMTNWNPWRVVGPYFTVLYFIGQMNSLSNIFPFPFCAPVLKPSLNLFVAELKRLCQHVSFSDG